MPVRWFGDRAARQLRAALQQHVDQAGAELSQAITDAIATPGPPRSSPGDPPHVDTDRLHRSWTHHTAGNAQIIVSRVSTDTPYAIDLEYGTSHVAARPFIVPTVITTSDAIGRRMCGY